MANVYGAQGVSPTLRGQPTNVWMLQAGAAMLVPSGTWKLALGRYLKAQEYDPITTIWRDIGDDGPGDVYLQSDGANHRVANQTGCAIGAFITNGGSGYTSAPTVTPSAGTSIWTAVIGGAVNTTVTVGNGGSNYLYPPIVAFSVPPSPGVQATGYATISGGIVTTITMTDQGAGYVAAPTVSLLNDPRDTAGSGATATTSLTASGQVTAVLCTDHGNPVTGTTVPTLSFTGGGGANATAVVLMCWSIVAISVAAAGAGYTGGAGYVELQGLFGSYTSTTTYTNPGTELGLLRFRPSRIYLPTGAGGTIATTASGFQFVDGGLYAGLPSVSPGIIGQGSNVITTSSITFSMGGYNSSFRMFGV